MIKVTVICLYQLKCKVCMFCSFLNFQLLRVQWFPHLRFDFVVSVTRGQARSENVSTIQYNKIFERAREGKCDHTCA